MVPWSSGNRDRLVKSTTGDQPHLVKPHQKQSQQFFFFSIYLNREGSISKAVLQLRPVYSIHV